MRLDFINVTLFCFAASYATALGLEVWHQFRPRPILRLVSLVFGGAGLLAHTLFVLNQDLPLETPRGSLVFLAWILAVFYLYGSIHHARLAWGLFVLPLVLGLSVLAALFPAAGQRDSEGLFQLFASFQGEDVWGEIHGLLLLLSAVGVSVAFVASVMYLVQVHRLKAKLPPGQGVRLLSLERLEEMNRRGILAAFPLLTAGLLVGIAMQMQSGSYWEGWTSPKILSVVGLWLVFAILLYVRYAVHARGKQVAWLTLMAFALLILALGSAHPLLAK
jgi:ABC-type transport system involved in cytochrome c biogenesis permease subunit